MYTSTQVDVEGTFEFDYDFEFTNSDEFDPESFELNYYEQYEYSPYTEYAFDYSILYSYYDEVVFDYSMVTNYSIAYSYSTVTGYSYISFDDYVNNP